MSSLTSKIKIYLGREPDFTSEVKLQNDGSGDYIKEWNISSEKSKPTDSQLNAADSEATKLENNNKIRATRRNLYGDIGDQLDEIFKDIDAWKTRIQKIKTDNPKE
tara:strand:- start:320 stop:637 length:318 start_codon:yes stop_codon:yes gene_type:complete